MRPDQVTLGVLVDSVPRDAVDAAIAVCGVRERRSEGKLPAHVVTYLTLALCLLPDDDEEVATKVTGSLDRWGCWNAAWSVPTASVITQARKRLGRTVFPELFERTCGPVAGTAGPGAAATALGTARGSFLCGWRLLAIDGFDVDVPDSKENAAGFGYAGSGENRSAFPKARVVALAECGTHAFVAAYHVGEKTLAGRLYPRLRADELLTADRGFYSWAAWDSASATGAALAWRAPTVLSSSLCAGWFLFSLLADTRSSLGFVISRARRALCWGRSRLPLCPDPRGRRGLRGQGRPAGPSRQRSRSDLRKRQQTPAARSVTCLWPL
ncbi:transposase domain-containing protein, partial [Frankia sp. CcWB2]